MLLTLRVLAASSLILAGGSAEAATASYAFGTPGITIEPAALRQTVAGVTIRARGYVAESKTAAVPVFGPFPTSVGPSGYRNFGIDIRELRGEQLGLLVEPVGGIATSGSDRGGGGVDPGFDNFGYLSGSSLPKSDFAVFEFSSPVSVHSVTVDDVTNHGRSVWLAWGNTPPNFSNGLVSALNGFTVKTSDDDATDGSFTHRFNATNVRYLMVGARQRGFDIGPIVGIESEGVAFYIANVEFTTSGGGGGATTGDDVIVGTAGPDSIDALAGNDTVRGLGGADILTGNIGVDQMSGGPGKDRFRYRGNAVQGYHSGVGAGRRDRITDFAAGDKIELTGVDADATRAGDQAFQYVGNGRFTRPGQIRWQFIGAVTLVQFNTDADALPEFEIELTNRFVPTAASFVP